MFFPWTTLNQWHAALALCASGVGRKCRRLVDQEALEGGDLDFKAYNQPLVIVSLFQYLGQKLPAVDY